MASNELTPAELEEQLERLHEDSFGWALSCCAWDRTDAEDVLQTTYLKVVSGRARFGGRSAFRTWLFGVIKRTAQELMRSAASQRTRADRVAAEIDPDGAMAESAEEEVARAETRRLLLEALELLPERQREVLHLVFYQDLSIREAAEVMQVSLGSARVHYDRGKKRLRTLLSEEAVRGGGAP